jgi:uncharacterized protein with gpF-like domain
VTARADEIARQQRLLDRLESVFRRAMAAEIESASREMVRVWELTGEVPTVAQHFQAVEALFIPMAERATLAFGGRVLSQGKAKGYRLETKDFAETMTRIALRYVALEAVRRRIVSISDTTRARIVAGVAAGFEAGLGQAEVAKEILARVPDINKGKRGRAGLIARTETHGAANNGATEAARELGIEYQREWLAADDKRTRATHAAADGQIVGKDVPFMVGGSALMYPGDPAGPAAETINCRCVVAFVVD